MQTGRDSSLHFSLFRSGFIDGLEPVRDYALRNRFIITVHHHAKGIVIDAAVADCFQRRGLIFRRANLVGLAAGFVLAELPLVEPPEFLCACVLRPAKPNRDARCIRRSVSKVINFTRLSKLSIGSPVPIPSTIPKRTAFKISININPHFFDIQCLFYYLINFNVPQNIPEN